MGKKTDIWKNLPEKSLIQTLVIHYLDLEYLWHDMYLKGIATIHLAPWDFFTNE